MRRHWLLVIIIGLLIGLYSRTEAEVLCRDRSGALFAREACRKTELRLNATALGLVGPPGPKGEKGERGPRGQQGPEGDSSTSTPRKPEPTSAGDPQPRPLWGPAWLLFVTVGLVLFYTIETYRLRREAQTQTELQLRPFVIFEPTEGKGFCVRNIGNNTALNVKVRDFALSSSPPVLAAFPWPVPFLRQGQDQPLQGRRASVEGAGVAEDFFDILHPMNEFAESETDASADHFRPTITIEFENVKRQRYFVQESLLHGNLEIMNFGLITIPYSSKLWSAWQTLRVAWQKLWTTWQQLRVRKRERVSEATTIEEKDWVDG